MRDSEHYLFYSNTIVNDINTINNHDNTDTRTTNYVGAAIVLDADESNHAVSVLRIKTGQRIQITDGTGAVYDCQCDDIHKHSVSCKVVGKRQIPKIAPDLTLLIGLPDKERFETILEYATALGVSRIVPIAADHCRKPWWGAWDWLRQRFQSKMVVSMKQSLYPYLPQLDAPTPLREAAAGCVGVLLVADQEGECLNDAEILPHKRINCLIGPPGGLSRGESEFLESYTAIPVMTVKIASTRLRSELAATALCSRVIAAHLR